MKIKLSFFAMMISVCMTAGCGGLGSGAANNISQDTLHSAELEDQHTGEMGIILDDAIREIEEFTPTESFDDDLMHELKSALIAVLRENSTDRYVSQKSVNAISDLHIWRDQPGNQDYRISWTYENIGDYDLNGEVNVADLTRIAVYFNAKIGDPNWSSARVADGDGNGEVNISDVTPIGVHFKNFIGSYRIEGTMADGSETWTVVETVDRSDVLKDDPALEIDYELNQPGYDKYRAMSIDSKGRIQRESNTDYIIKLTGKAILLGPDSGNLFDRYTNGWYYVELEGSNEAITEESIVFGGGSTGSSENGFIVDVEEVEILDSNSLRFRGSSVDVNKVINDGYWDLVLPLRGNNVFGNGKGVSRISPVRVEDFAKIRESMTNDPLVIDFSDTSLYEDQFLSIYLSNARLEITPDVYCRVDKFLGVPYELEMSAAGEVSLDLDINADVDIQGEYSPEPIEIPSPPPVPWSLGPVFGDLDLNLYVGATVNGQVQAEATTGFDATSSFSIGADWRSGRQPAWVSSADVTSSFNYHPLTIVATAEGFVQLYLIIELQARVWKVGPNFSVKPFTQLDCELSYPPLEGNAELSWATDVCAGFDFELFELEFEYEKCFNVIPLQHIEYWEFVDEPTTFVAEGYVYEDDGTTPLSGVTMSFTGGHASVQTNGSGYWLRDGLSNGSYTVTPAKSGWTFSPAERSFSIDGSDRTVGSFLGAQEVILHSAEGYVYEDDGTTPLSGVTMSFTGGHASVQTNGSGYWLRDGLSNGSYTVTPAKSGWTFSPAERSFSIDGSDRTVGSFLGAQEVILHSAEGYVYEDDGTTPLSGVTMSFTGGHAYVQTNGSGYWIRDGLPNGSYTVSPAKSGWTFSPAERSFSIDGSDRTVGSFLGAQEVLLHSAEGYVYEDDGTTPLSGVTMSFTGGHASVQTNGSGYWIRDGLPNGSYTVTPAKSGWTFSPAERSFSIDDSDRTVGSFLGTYIVVPPDIPVNVTATKGTQSHTIDIDWDDVPGATNYKVYESDTAGVLGDLIATPSLSSYTRDPDSDGVNYYYTIKATNAGGDSGESSQARGWASPPDRCTNVTVTDDGSSWTISFDRPNPKDGCTFHLFYYVGFITPDIYSSDWIDTGGFTSNSQITIPKNDFPSGTIWFAIQSRRYSDKAWNDWDWNSGIWAGNPVTN